MPISESPLSQRYAGNNSTTAAYPINIERDRDGDLFVTIDGVASSNFTISVDGLRTGTPIPDTSEILLFRVTPQTQIQTFPANTTPAGEDVRQAVNKLTLIAQEAQELSDRSFKLPRGASNGVGFEATSNTTLVIGADGNAKNETVDETNDRLGIPVFIAQVLDATAEANVSAANSQVGATNSAASAARAEAIVASSLAAVSLITTAPKLRNNGAFLRFRNNNLPN